MITAKELIDNFYAENIEFVGRRNGHYIYNAYDRFGNLLIIVVDTANFINVHMAKSIDLFAKLVFLVGYDNLNLILINEKLEFIFESTEKLS